VKGGDGDGDGDGGSPVIVPASSRINVRDFAMKLNNQAQKKSTTFRPSWVKQTTLTDRPSNHVMMKQQENVNAGKQQQEPQLQQQQQQQQENVHSNNIRAVPWDRGDCRKQPLPSPMVRDHVGNELKQLESDKVTVESPTSKKSQKEEVLEKAHFWRNQASQQSKQIMSSPCSSSSYGIIKNDKAKAKYDSPPLEKKQSQHQLRYTKAVDKIRNRGSSRSPMRKQIVTTSKMNNYESSSDSADKFGTDEKVITSIVPIATRAIPNDDVLTEKDELVEVRRQVTPVKDGVASNINDMGSGNAEKTSPIKAMGVKALGRRFQVGAVVSPDMNRTRLGVQKQELSSLSKSPSTRGELFQSKIAKFSGKKTSMPHIRKSTTQTGVSTSSQISEASLVNSDCKKHSESVGSSVECLQAHGELMSESVRCGDLRGSSKEKIVRETVVSQFRKNQTVTATDPKSKNNSPKNKDTVGSVSQKAQFWINQRESGKSSEPRGRRIGLQPNIRSLSQQSKPIENEPSSKSSPSTCKTGFQIRSPSSPPTLGRLVAGSSPENNAKSMSTSADDMKNEYMHYINRNRTGRKGVMSHEDSLEMDEQEQENFLQTLRKSKAFTGDKYVKKSLESVGEERPSNTDGVLQKGVEKSKHHLTDTSSGSYKIAANEQDVVELETPRRLNFTNTAAMQEKVDMKKQNKASKNREATEHKDNFLNKGLSSERSIEIKKQGSPVRSQSIYVADSPKEKLENRAKDEAGSSKKNKFSWPPTKEMKSYDEFIIGAKQNAQNPVSNTIQKSGSTQESLSPNMRPFDETSTPPRNASTHNSSMPRSPLSNSAVDKLVHSPPKCARTTSDVIEISSHTNAKFVSVNTAIGNISKTVGRLDEVTSHVDESNRKKDGKVETLQSISTPKSSGSTVSRKLNNASTALLTPRSIATTVAATDDSQLETTQGMRTAGQIMEYDISTISPIREDSRNVCDHETFTVNTDTSSFLPVSEVKKRLWDEGEKLKWQKNETPQTKRSLFPNEKEASIFKSRYYHAAEIAQKHCLENKDSIPIPSRFQPSGRDTTPANGIPQRSSDVQVETLIAKLSSIKRDDPDAALKAIDSILENHGGKETNLDCIADCQAINESAVSPILAPKYFEESSFEGEEETSSMYSDSDDSTVSSITNPTYMSGFGEPSLRKHKKQQSSKLITSVGRLKPPLQSTTAPSFKDHPYSKHRASELPPLQPRQDHDVHRKLKPLKVSNKSGKSKIRRKSVTGNGVLSDPNENNLPSPNHNTASGMKTKLQSLELSKSEYKPPAKLTGGKSSSNLGLLSKLKDIGSDSDDKDDDTAKPPKSPLSPGERLKMLAVAADRVENVPETQHRLLDRKRRFLYPKRGPSLEKERMKSTAADLQPQTNDGGDSAWLPTEHMDVFDEDFFHTRRENTGNANDSNRNEFHPFDPFGGVAVNDSFAHEVLAEKFSRMEKAYQYR
jgi:hypothetical protein